MTPFFRRVPKEEVNRKFLHILVVCFPLVIFYGPIYSFFSREWMVAASFGLFLFASAIEFLRFRNKAFRNWFTQVFGSMLRACESKQLTGGFHVVAAILICSVLSLHSEAMAASSFLAFTLFIIGDAAAALFGKAVGRIKIGQKTIEGAVGCFLICLILCWLVSSHLPLFADFWGKQMNLGYALALSLTVSLLELFPFKYRGIYLNDNLYVPPLVALFAMYAI
jgi:dolichol kinase